MKKEKISEKEEACTLLVDTNKLSLRLVGDFLKYSGGCFKMEKDSPHYIATVKLERKKEMEKR